MLCLVFLLFVLFCFVFDLVVEAVVEVPISVVGTSSPQAEPFFTIALLPSAPLVFFLVIATPFDQLVEQCSTFLHQSVPPLWTWLHPAAVHHPGAGPLLE